MEKKFNSISEEVKTLINEFMETVNGECDRKDIRKICKGALCRTFRWCLMVL